MTQGEVPLATLFEETKLTSKQESLETLNKQMIAKDSAESMSRDLAFTMGNIIIEWLGPYYYYFPDSDWT